MGPLLSILLAGTLQGGVAPEPFRQLGIPAPGQGWVEDPPTSRAHRAFKNTTRRLLLPTLEVGLCNVPSIVFGLTFSLFDQRIPKDFPLRRAKDAAFDILAWHVPSFQQWQTNILALPVFPDRDSHVFNFIIHPWVGLTVHMLYRNHGATWWQAALAVILWAVFWEYVAEASYERPALNDILANTGGALLGEGMWRAKELIRNQMAPGIPRTLLLALLDPFGTLETVVLDVAEYKLGMRPVVGYLR